MPRTIWLAVLVFVTMVSANSTACAVDPTISQNSAYGTVDGGNISFPVSGSYNVGSFGPVGKVTIKVKRTDADGSNPVYSEVFEATLPNGNPNSGTYSKVANMPHVAGKRYFVLVYLYDSNNQPLKPDGYSERYYNDPLEDIDD
jgi:hypothetical protein